MSVRVKICGLTNPRDMEAAVSAGADYVGVVFADSPRRVRLEELEEWLEDARGDAEVVGVFRDQEPSAVLEYVERFDLDFVQLHGSESMRELSRLPVRLIEASIVDENAVPPPRFPGMAWARLLDSGAGSGKRFDWKLALPLARAERVFLAGGLSPENVADAIRQVAPFAVDVSSGVELAGEPGRKDAELIGAFIGRAREAGGR